MKKIACLFCAVMLLLPLFRLPGAAAGLETKEKDGIVYTCVNTKAAYYEMARRAIENHQEHIYVYYLPDKIEWDDSYSNNGPNFTHYNTQTQFDDYLDYSADSVCITASPEIIYAEDGSVSGTSEEYWGTIDVTFLDTKEELDKADAEIRRILSKISSKSKVEQLRYVVDYICDKAQYGSQELPDGGYDRINGVYDILTGVRTNTVCTSYAVTLMRFMELMGLDNVILSNQQSVHAWNMVKLDGKWYGIDCTAEDGNRGTYFLMGRDRLKSYDTSQCTPVAAFAKKHAVASAAHSTSGKDPASRPVQSTAQPSKNSASPSSSAAVSSDAANNSSPTVTEPYRVDITAGSTVVPEVFLQAAQKEQDLSLEGDGFRWLFAKEELRGLSLTDSFDAAVKRGDDISPAQQEQVKQAAGDTAVYPFAFAHHGKLPAKAKVSIRLEEQYADKQVYVYYLDENSRPVQAAYEKVSADAMLTFSTDHCSLWFISEQAVGGTEMSKKGLPVWGWVSIGIGAALVLAATVAAVLYLVKKQHQKTNPTE